MKTCLPVFRSPHTMEKSVEACQIRLNIDDSLLEIIVKCRSGLVKTYNLRFQESETLQAIFAKESCQNILSLQPKLLLGTISNFVQRQEEVTIIADSQHLQMKNYVDDEDEPKRALLTKLSLFPDDFESYQIGVNSEITFCLKELRAILAFSEAVNQQIAIHFETGGRPIMFSLTSDLSFQADFVLATLMEDAASSQQTQVQSQERRLNARTSTPLHRNPTDVSGHAVVSQELSCIDRMVDQVDSVPVEAAASPEMTPRKKFRSMFFGATAPPVQKNVEILAPDTDDEQEEGEGEEEAYY
ncbi:cell cycle checkpoint control protein RAD9B-like [Oscarella lobularis]|uniref:cell cycle checkpoint control protein RAD9B-like n=1 Tax=Oscarella lobularis TaxID=121494 RepID=UPI0033140148